MIGGCLPIVYVLLSENLPKKTNREKLFCRPAA